MPSYHYIDPRFVLENAEHSPQLIADLLHIFEAQFIDYKKQFAVAKEDYDSLQFARNLHKLKSACGIWGIRKLLVLIKDLESTDAGKIPHQYMHEFAGEFDRICTHALVEIRLLVANQHAKLQHNA